MNITATYHGAQVTIVSVSVNGSMIYVTYVDASNNVKVGKDFFSNGSDVFTLATSATIN